MTDRPFPITLVLVSYNKADVVSLSLESAAKGSMAPDLVVLSDDGSDDGTPDVAEATAKKLGLPIRVIRHPRVGRYRIQAMRNTCAANALEGVVYLSDSDCIFGEHAIESHYAIHRTHCAAVGTGPRYEYLEGHSGPFTSTFVTLEFAHFPYGMHCVPVGANYSFPKRLWRQAGGFDRAFDGSYGMEEFEFSARCERAGAVCVSDPGAYVFHIPHETVFGHRKPFRNIRVFDRKYGTEHIAQEQVYIRDRVTPWYWRGKRKQPLLGDRVKLNEWGAPDGFVPPLHLRLSRTLRPMIDPVERYLDTGSDSDFQDIAALPQAVDWKMLGQTSPALIYLQDLNWIVRNVREKKDRKKRLRYWLDGAGGVERSMPGLSSNGHQS